MHLLLALALMGVLGMDDLTTRVTSLEAQALGLRSQVAQLQDEAVRSRRSRDAAAMQPLLNRLDPGSLTTLASYRGGGERLPALAQPLLTRLRDDPGLPGMAGGRAETEYPNLLIDPLFEDAGAGGDYIGAAYTAMGTQWEVRYVLNSGTAPAGTDMTWGPYYGRTTGGIGFESSATVAIAAAFGINASDISFYARPVTSWTVDPWLVPSWITAAVAAIGPVVTGLATATLYVEICDSADNILAQSDPLDLIAFKDGSLDSLVTYLETAYEDPVASTDYRWRLHVDATKTAGATANLTVRVADPLLAYSDDGSAPAFSPHVGFWWGGGGGGGPIVVGALAFQGAKVYRTATLTLADATPTAVAFDTGNALEEYDTSAFHDLVTNSAQMVAPENGYYRVSFGAVFAANATGYRAAWIELNADGVVRALRRDVTPSGTEVSAIGGTTTVYLAAGEYARLIVYQNRGGALSLGLGDRSSFIEMVRVGGPKGDTGTTGATGGWSRTYDPGSQSVPDASFALHYAEMRLSTTERLTHAGASRIVLADFATPTRIAPDRFRFPYIGAAGAETEDGVAVWDPGNNYLVVGDGSTQRYFLPLDGSTPQPVTYGGAAATGSLGPGRVDHVHAGPYAWPMDPGASVSIPDATYVEQYNEFRLSSSERLTAAGTGRLLIEDTAPAAMLVGFPKVPSVSFTVPSGYLYDLVGRMTLANQMRASLLGTADLWLVDDFGTRSRIVLTGRG